MNLLLFNFNGILDDVEDELIRRGHTIIPHVVDGMLADWRKADVAVVWQETELGGWKKVVKMMQKKGIPVILFQHGRRGTSRIFPPFNEELVSDVLCVWGENDVRRMTSCGVPKEKIRVTGTSILKHIKPKIPHKGYNVVFSPEHWDKEVPENFMVRDALRELVQSRHFWQKKIQVVSKLLEHEHDPMNYDNPIVSNRSKRGHLDICIETLQTADAVVAVSESTFELLAEAMDIPVIIADIWIPKACDGDDRYKEYQREYSHACERVQDMSQLGERVLYHLLHPDTLKKERQEIVIGDGGSNIADPVGEIVKVIEQEHEANTLHRHI